MKILIFAAVLITSLSVQALECNVIIVTDQEVVEGSFEAPIKSQGHNVPEQTVEGKINKVSAMADGKWLGISWSQNEELIAESINLIRDSISQPRVLIVYNPKNVDEQVSIDCAQK